MSAPPTPTISVIVFAREAVETITAALRSLQHQDGIDHAEVIVADGSVDGTRALVESGFPWVRHLKLPPSTMLALKGAAMQAARADIVAILDPTAAADVGWLRDIRIAFQDPEVVAVGGSVRFDADPSVANHAAYMFEYGAFEPPIASGPTNGDLPGNNVVYRRAAVLALLGDALNGVGFDKPVFHDALRARGHALQLRPTMRVGYRAKHQLRAFLVRRFHYGRCFGARRWTRSTPARRAMYFLGAPAIPALLVKRHLVRAWRHPEQRRLLRTRAFPLIAVCLTWGVGEWLGYWFGAGRSCEMVY